MAQTLYLPLNDPATSSEARNVVNTSRPLVVRGGSFVEATGGNYLNLPGGAVALMEGASPIDLSKSFTFTARLRTDSPAGTVSYIMLAFQGSGRVLSMPIPLTAGNWQTLTIRQAVNNGIGNLTVQVDSTLVEGGNYPTGWGLPIGLAIYDTDTRYAVGGTSWANVEVVDVVTPTERAQFIGPVTFEVLIDKLLTRPQLIGPVTFDLLVVTGEPEQPEQPAHGQVLYRLNGYNWLSAYGIRVSKSDGLLDRLAMKEPKSFDWRDGHGQWVDLSAPKFQPRTIKLECYIKATGVADLLNKWAAFTAELAKPYTQRLQVNVFNQPPLVYEVYAPDAIELKKRWKDGVMYGTFELNLIEPDPIKRVIAFTGPGTLAITLTTVRSVAFHWGDGTHTYDVYGARTVEHAYAGSGTFYAVVSGDIAGIHQFTHNGTLVWRQL